MITEDYVSFETAKLLKEKGFDEPCMFLYFAKYKPEGDFKGNFNETKNSEINELSYSAPTLQMAMKWLRKEHHLVIQIEFIDFLENGELWLYSIIERNTIKRLTYRDEDFTEHSYEEACDAAIKYCLENFI